MFPLGVLNALKVFVCVLVSCSEKSMGPGLVVHHNL